MQMQKTYSGPYPEPEQLAKYEQIQPGFAERLIVMAEIEQKERHDLQAKIYSINERMFNEEIKLQKRGQNYALVSIILITIRCCYGFFLGHASESMKIAIGVILGVVGLFVTGKWFRSSQSKSQEEEKELLNSK